MTPPDISVVVPAHNAATTLAAVLEGLRGAGFAASDIIVVNDGSSDTTADIARGFEVTCISNPVAKGAAAARNRGAAETRGDLILFVDADVVVHADVRDRLITWSENHPKDAALFGSYDDHPADRHRISRIRNLLHHHTHQTAPPMANTFWTGLGAVRRPAFETIGGFDPDQAFMEDIAFGHALHAAGHTIRLDRDIQGTHLKRWTLAGFLRTDLLHRAIPWSRLIKSADAPRTLNAGRQGMASVSAVGFSLLAIAALPLAPVFAMVFILLSLGALALLNRSFLQLLYRLDGLSEVLSGLAILWLHFGVAGLGYAWVTLKG